MNKKIPVLCVVGPTASGKTAMAVSLAEALGGEIISADSMQIYKYMDIATAKVTRDETRGISHHLIDIIGPGEDFSVADFVAAASRSVNEIVSRGHLPVVAGGTGLYVTSFIDNIKFGKAVCDDSLREELSLEYDKVGGEAMLEEMKSFDPASAAKLHPNDKKRIVRAFEVYRSTGCTRSRFDAESRTEESPYDPYMLGLYFDDRAKLYDRINQRVDIMLENGLIEEAKRVFELYGENSTALQAIGYKELLPYLRGECTLGQAADVIKLETRRYAKRQLSWFRRDSRIRWINMSEPVCFESLVFDIHQHFNF